MPGTDCRLTTRLQTSWPRAKGLAMNRFWTNIMYGGIASSAAAILQIGIRALGSDNHSVVGIIILFGALLLFYFQFNRFASWLLAFLALILIGFNIEPDQSWTLLIAKISIVASGILAGVVALWILSKSLFESYLSPRS